VARRSPTDSPRIIRLQNIVANEMDGMKHQTRAGKNGNRPPERTKWKKGCPSPNPEGARARLPLRWFSEAAKAKLAEIDPRLQKTGAEQLIDKAFRRALQGSYKHLDLILAYAEGKPAQSVDLNVTTSTRNDRLTHLSTEEVKLMLSLMQKPMLTAEEQTQLGVLTWKMGQNGEGKPPEKQIEAQVVSRHSIPDGRFKTAAARSE
jgi:hypothetical protein